MFKRDYRPCTRRAMPMYAAHAASVIEDYTWDDSPVTPLEFVREFASAAFLIGGALLIAWVCLA